MKVKVKHWGIVERTVEIDDKFDALRGYYFGDTGEGDELMDELIDTVLREVPASVDELYNIATDDGEILTEF